MYPRLEEIPSGRERTLIEPHVLPQVPYRPCELERSSADPFAAKEASKQIMEDLLMSAGGDLTDDLDPDSPSVVKRGATDEDTF